MTILSVQERTVLKKLKLFKTNLENQDKNKLQL